MEQAISDLLIAGSVVECGCAPTVVNPLSVSIQANGKKRLILDLRYPNQFVKKSKIKFEDAKTMLYSFIDCSQNWLFSFDIKSGYHHIDIFPPDQEFLGFSWSKDGVIRFYKFTVPATFWPPRCFFCYLGGSRVLLCELKCLGF